MSELFRFGVSAENDLVESYDRLISKAGYATRSEAIRDLMRDALVRERVQEQPEGKTEVLGTLTLVYDHHAHDLSDQMAHIQHEQHGLVISVLHVHVNRDDCMEVIALRGQASGVRALAASLLSMKGVKHGKLFITLPSRTITGRTKLRKDSHGHPHSHKHSPLRRRSQTITAR